MSYLKLRSLVEALRERGRDDEADFFSIVIPAQVYVKYGVSEEKTMQMTLEEIEKLHNMPMKPEKYRGWNFWWGEEAFR